MFEINLDDSQLQARLRAVKLKLGSLRTVMEEIGEELTVPHACGDEPV